jgi:hypothetical protein
MDAPGARGFSTPSCWLDSDSLSLSLYNYDMRKVDFQRRFGADFEMVGVTSYYEIVCRVCGRQWSVGKRDLREDAGELRKVLEHAATDIHSAA